MILIYVLILFFLVPALIVGVIRFEFAYHAWKSEQAWKIHRELSECFDWSVLPCSSNTIGTISLPDVTMREAATALATMSNAGARVRDLLPEQCSHTQTNEDGMEMVLPVEEMH
jgi:hypothetical protein